jgi:hypothetical protein
LVMESSNLRTVWARPSGVNGFCKNAVLFVI